MTVMAAGMHLPWYSRRVTAVGDVFSDIQRIHIGAQSNDSCAIADTQVGHQTCTANSTMHLQSQAIEDSGNVVRRDHLFKTGLGMLVQMLTPMLELGVKILLHVGPLCSDVLKQRKS